MFVMLPMANDIGALQLSVNNFWSVQNITISKVPRYLYLSNETRRQIWKNKILSSKNSLKNDQTLVILRGRDLSHFGHDFLIVVVK